MVKKLNNKHTHQQKKSEQKKINKPSPNVLGCVLFMNAFVWIVFFLLSSVGWFWFVDKKIMASF